MDEVETDCAKYASGGNGSSSERGRRWVYHCNQEHYKYIVVSIHNNRYVGARVPSINPRF
jgi:hypothetical protein